MVCHLYLWLVRPAYGTSHFPRSVPAASPRVKASDGNSRSDRGGRQRPWGCPNLTRPSRYPRTKLPIRRNRPVSRYPGHILTRNRQWSDFPGCHICNETSSSAKDIECIYHKYDWAGPKIPDFPNIFLEIPVANGRAFPPGFDYNHPRAFHPFLWRAGPTPGSRSTINCEPIPTAAWFFQEVWVVLRTV